MKKLLPLVLLSFLSITTYSQKIKIEDNVATVDGKPYLNWKSNGVFDPNTSISALDSQKDEIFVTYVSYKDPNRVTTGNPEGNVSWLELNFLAFGKKCEIDNKTQKGLVKFVIENKLYVDGALNEENVNLVIAKYGMRYSENRPGGNVIINIGN